MTSILWVDQLFVIIFYVMILTARRELISLLGIAAVKYVT